MGINKNITEMSETDFKTIVAIAYKEAGLVFPPEKASLVKSRINRRLRKLKIHRFSDYTAYVASDSGSDERRIMVSSLTTNVSSFFREQHHFEILRDKVFPELAERARSGDRIRIWSAGCSTGQEPYSIAMTLLEHVPDAESLGIKILATDIDPTVIATAKYGFYDDFSVRDISKTFQEKFLVPSQKGIRTGFQMTENIRNLVTFRELNLLGKWPIFGCFDVIFCRNVVIYFDEETQLSLWGKFESVSTKEGWLFVGHSERLSDNPNSSFTCAGPTTYRRSNQIIRNLGVEAQ